MYRDRLEELLQRVKSGDLPVTDAVERLRTLPFETLDGMATVDHHRELRSGVPEVVFGEGKNAAQIAALVASLAADGGGALATRVDADKAQVVLARVPEARYHELSRTVVVPPAGEAPERGRGVIAVVAAGTSDLPVAEEAAVVAEFLGNRVERITDVGVAGLQRVLVQAERLRQVEVVVVIAGMEGALPSVVAGLVDRPIIAVPTSVGYGVGLGGFAAMLGMLSSCSPGVTVVNIDNGFGAAVAASLINRSRA
jgi:pyridinium-3,5-biscarboxylic acid mononucleotide synthase